MSVLQLDRDFVLSRFGSIVDFGPCLAGASLNMLVLRGFGRLDELAVISAPDVFDQYENPTGTQRELKKKHAQECFDYAIESVDLPPEENPRAFPEVLLNVRDLSVIEIYDFENHEILDLDSFDAMHKPKLVGLRVRLDRLTFPKRLYRPQVSRVDGNHRLYGADQFLAELMSSGGDDSGYVNGALSLPTIPFAMLVGLDQTAEASLFRDINGEHEGMETAHLDNLAVRLHDPNTLKSNPKTLPLWIAHELAKPGRAFEDSVFLGGSKVGVKRRLGGKVPPIKLNALKSTIDYQLKSAPRATAMFKTDPDALLELIDRYWSAVRQTFPNAWQNRSDYILLQSIGLGGFARFGGMLLDDAVESGEVQIQDFKNRLSAIDEQLLSKSNEQWRGIAGLAGAARVAEVLLQVTESDDAKYRKIVSELRPKSSLDDRLGLQK